MAGARLTHIDEAGRARMVDVSDKADTHREAVAEGMVRMKAQTLALLESGETAKGNVLAVSEVAGIMAAKRTAELIPLCHPLPLSSVRVTIVPDDQLPGVVVNATCRTTGKTGVEMEALTAASTACLTVYDMLKAVDREMRIEGIRVLTKTGGASGEWSAEDVSQ